MWVGVGSCGLGFLVYDDVDYVFVVVVDCKWVIGICLGDG